MTVELVEQSRQPGATASGGYTFPGHAAAQVGDLQVVVTSTWSAHAATTTTAGWEVLGYELTTTGRATVLWRRIEADPTAGVALTWADKGGAIMRTYRGAVSVKVIGRADGLVAPARTISAGAKLLRVTTAAYNNTASFPNNPTLTPDAGLSGGTGAHTYEWFSGIVAGDEPNSGAVPARTATQTGETVSGGNTQQVVDILIGPESLVYEVERLAERVALEFNGLTIDRLVDVDTDTVPPALGNVLLWSGSAWTPGEVTGDGGVEPLPDPYVVAKQSGLGPPTIVAPAATQAGDLAFLTVSSGDMTVTAAGWTFVGGYGNTGYYGHETNVFYREITGPGQSMPVSWSDTANSWVWSVVYLRGVAPPTTPPVHTTRSRGQSGPIVSAVDIAADEVAMRWVFGTGFQSNGMIPDFGLPYDTLHAYAPVSSYYWQHRVGMTKVDVGQIALTMTDFDSGSLALTLKRRAFEEPPTLGPINLLTDVDTATDPPVAGETLVFDGSLWVPKPAGVPAGGTTGQVLKKTSGADYAVAWQTESGGGGGGSSPYELKVDLPMTTLTGWTLGAGTWTADANGIRQASTATGVRRCTLDTKVPLADVIAEVQIRVNAGASTVNMRGGLNFGGLVGMPFVVVNASAGGTNINQLYFEADSWLALGATPIPAPIPFGTWMTLRLHKTGNTVTAWLDGVLIDHCYFPVQESTNSYPVKRGSKIGLYTYDADVTFRNLRVWTPPMPV